MRTVGKFILIVTLYACAPAQPCQEAMEIAGSERTAMLTIDSNVGGIVSQIFAPTSLGRYPDGAPVVVYVHGGWRTNFVPLDESLSHINPGLGMVQLYLNLPGGKLGEGSDSEGREDKRGESARAAVAAVLRYATGTEADSDGCHLSDRIDSPLSGQLALAGYSNGGNLAWATLADPDLDLPEVVGVATYETPAADQFVVVEPGTLENPSPVYIEGACTLPDGIRCDYDYSGLAFDADAEDDGVLFIDEAGDGTFDGSEFRLGAVLHDGRWYHSLPARQAAITQGLTLLNRASPEDTDTFWAEREAPRQLADAVARFPDIAGVSVGSDHDHVLTGAVEHPHVTGMVAAMRAADIRWSRLHPDSAYTTLISRSGQDFPDHDANIDVAVGADLQMMPRSAAAHGEDYLTAAVVELLDRAHDAEWESNLDAVLYR